MNPLTITTSTFTLRNSSNVLVPATVAYNATTLMATLTPSRARAGRHVYGHCDQRHQGPGGNSLVSGSWASSLLRRSDADAGDRRPSSS
jgi:hypothetical protein